MATAILLRVHEISRATACELLAVSEHDLPRLVQEVMAVVSGDRQDFGDDRHWRDRQLTSEDNTLRWDEAPRPASEDSLGSSQSGPRRSGLDEKQIPSEVFARALKDTVNSGSLPSGGSATSWNAAGGLAGLSRRPSPLENPATPPAAGGPLQAQSPSRLAIDSSAILTGLGGLLAGDPRVLQDSLPVENFLPLAGFRDTRRIEIPTQPAVSQWGWYHRVLPTAYPRLTLLSKRREGPIQDCRGHRQSDRTGPWRTNSAPSGS